MNPENNSTFTLQLSCAQPAQNIFKGNFDTFSTLRLGLAALFIRKRKVVPDLIFPFAWNKQETWTIEGEVMASSLLEEVTRKLPAVTFKLTYACWNSKGEQNPLCQNIGCTQIKSSLEKYYPQVFGINNVKKKMQLRKK